VEVMLSVEELTVVGGGHVIQRRSSRLVACRRPDHSLLDDLILSDRHLP
jgi:hypothetical protein